MEILNLDDSAIAKLSINNQTMSVKLARNIRYIKFEASSAHSAHNYRLTINNQHID